jgi:hypothetical protein
MPKKEDNTGSFKNRDTSNSPKISEVEVTNKTEFKSHILLYPLDNAVCYFVLLFTTARAIFSYLAAVTI